MKGAHIMNAHHLTRVVVIGGGYAGLAFVQGLRRARLPGLDLTLVDRNPFHTLLTETHTVAAGNRPATLVEIPFSVLGPGVRTITADVISIDTERRLVVTNGGHLPYDHLALCLGGVDNAFGTPGVADHSLFLRGLRDAEHIRARLTALPHGAGVVVVGGGLTGVELAAEMALNAGGHRLVRVVEAAPSLLPGLPPALQLRARRRLEWLGATVLTGARVTAVHADKVLLTNGTVLPAGLVIWAAGVKGHPLVGRLGCRSDGSGRAIVDSHLRTDLPGVYVLGDSAAVRPAPDLPALAPSAQLAEQMGFAAAADLVNRLGGGPGVAFSPKLRGVLCDLGGLNAVGVVYRVQLHGLLGALAKRTAVLGHLWRTTGLKGFLRHLADTLRPAGSPQTRRQVN